MADKMIGLRRLCQQRLLGSALGSPEAVVGWLGAVQAQEYPGALWSLGLRMEAATMAGLEPAFASGAILRTHAMRPTWHFVLPADIRWLQELTGPRVLAASAYMIRREGLDDRVFAGSNAAIERALAGGRFLTRDELAAALIQAGIPAAGVRLAYLMMRAEVDALICSGPRRGKQFTYALLAERAPAARSLPRDEALARLTRQYFTGHGPATARDLSWWSGLTLADVQEGIASVRSELACEVIGDQTYWFSAAAPGCSATRMAKEDAGAGATAYLLPTYDEFLVGFAGFGAAITGDRPSMDNTFTATIVSGGQAVGKWRRTLSKSAVNVELAPFPDVAVEPDALVAAAQRYAGFLGLRADITWRAGGL